VKLFQTTLQRASSPEDLAHRRLRFSEELVKILPKRLADLVVAYFETNWMNDAWIDTWVDYSIIEHGGHRSTFSTNNYAESVFKTTDRVFLVEKP
jgi:hypothetical protein